MSAEERKDQYQSSAANLAKVLRSKITPYWDA